MYNDIKRPAAFLLLGSMRAWDEHVGALEKAGTVSGRRKTVWGGVEDIHQN